MTIHDHLIMASEHIEFTSERLGLVLKGVVTKASCMRVYVGSRSYMGVIHGLYSKWSVDINKNAAGSVLNQGDL